MKFNSSATTVNPNYTGNPDVLRPRFPHYARAYARIVGSVEKHNKERRHAKNLIAEGMTKITLSTPAHAAQKLIEDFKATQEHLRLAGFDVMEIKVEGAKA